MDDVDEINQNDANLHGAFPHDMTQGNRVAYVSGQPLLQDIQGEQDLTQFIGGGNSRQSHSLRDLQEPVIVQNSSADSLPSGNANNLRMQA